MLADAFCSADELARKIGTPQFRSVLDEDQIETVLSIAHQREPNPTQTAEAVTGRKSSFYLLIMIRRT